MKNIYFTYVLKILFHQIARHLDNTTSHDGFTGSQGRVLNYLISNSCKGDIFQRDIENEFDIRRSTATGILKLLEKNGMITRSPVPYDARLKKIVLTEKSIALTEKISAHLENIEKELIKNIADEDLKICFKVLSKMIKNLE